MFWVFQLLTTLICINNTNYYIRRKKLLYIIFFNIFNIKKLGILLPSFYYFTHSNLYVLRDD